MTARLRIAMLSIHSSPVGPLGTRDTGGMSVYVRETASGLASLGHPVDIFTCVEGTAPESRLYPGVRLIHLDSDRFGGISKSKLPAFLDAIFESLDRFKRRCRVDYDLIHSHYWISGAVGARAAKRWLRPHITMFHTLGAVKNRTVASERETAGRVAAERRIAATADGLVVPSYREKRHLIELYGGDPERIDVIPCGVDMDHFRDRGRKRSRSRLNLDVDTAVILYVGRYAPVKGLAGLVDAMALIPEAVPLRLLVVGGDGLRDLAVRIVHDQVERLGLRNRIHFCGRIEPAELPDYYSAADFLVLPSHYESFGLVVLEALACGTPVLATPVGAVESIIEKGTNGMVIANPQSDTLAAGIVAMIERNRQRPPVRDAVRASVNGFTWDGVVRRIERLYRTVIG